jgi:hypothetical protein
MENIINKNNLIYTVLASILAAIGLDANNLTAIIGSMLVSPLASPLLNIIENKNYIINLIQILILSIVCISIGLIYYIIVYGVNPYNNFIVTQQMKNISTFKGYQYIYDVFYALIIGICIYLAHVNKNDNNTSYIQVLTGVGIGISILPPFVNTGMLMGARMPIKQISSGIVLGSIYLIGMTSGIIFSDFLNLENILSQ